MTTFGRSGMTVLRLMSLTMFLLFVFATPTPLFSQSCALCYTQAASSGSKVIQALRSGILILIIPPTLATVGLIFVIHNRRNRVRRDENDEAEQEW